MSRSQPTEREAREAMRRLERDLSLPPRQTVDYPVIWDDREGFSIWVKGQRFPHWHEPIVSDVSKRCHDCGKVLVERHNNLVRLQCERGWESKQDIITYFDPKKMITLCVGCSNRRWPAVKALIEWNDVRLSCYRIGREVAKQKKEKRNEQH